ncbi:MAG: maleylpyruvate isomerase N-terminal domain-containing protein [Blastocatellia bacterium]
MTETLRPILTAHLYAKLEGLLIDLLRSLDAEEWERETIVPGWKVRDIAAHLLDTQLRKLSLARDGYAPEPPMLNSPADFVAFIDRLNREGVAIYRRLSPAVLISLMEVASRECDEHHRLLDPFAKAPFAVSWAGEAASENWFDTARELTERWHHQQQIRLAVDRPGIMTRELYFPVLDTFMRALPFHYRQIERTPGVMAQFDVSGECGGSWHLFREAGKWTLTAAAEGEQISLTTIPQEIAWRIFTKGIDREAAASQVDCQGDREAGLHVLRMLAIVG